MNSKSLQSKDNINNSEIKQNKKIDCLKENYQNTKIKWPY